jgi:hypothetical protein
MEDLRSDAQFMSEELGRINAELVTFHDKHIHTMTSDEMRDDLRRIINLPLAECSRCHHEFYRLAGDMVCEQCFWRTMQLY